MTAMRQPGVRRTLIVLPVVLLALFCGSCADFWVSESSLESIALSPAGLILKAASSSGSDGDSYAMTATGTTVGGTTEDITSAATWTSSDTSVATVSAGTVTAVATTSGATATITVKDDGKTETANVITYTGTAPSALTVSCTKFSSGGTVAAGTYQLHAYLYGTTTDVANYVTWSTSNSTATSISSSGVLTVNSVSTEVSVTVTAVGTLGASVGNTITGTLSFTAE
ncbi:MAG: hypothetical protein P4M01_13195 [Acidobacteriota bacterium]|nr:hypothetical protein [Acidobacteriota bacterium]